MKPTLSTYRSHFDIMMVQGETLAALSQTSDRGTDGPGLSITSIALIFDNLVNVLADRSEFRNAKADGKTRAFESAADLYEEFAAEARTRDLTDKQKTALSHMSRAVAMVQHQYPDAFPTRVVFV